MKDWNRPGMPEEMKRVEDAQKNKMDQGSPKGMKWAKEAQKQHEYKPNDSTGLLELSRGKVDSRPKRGLASTSQMITWQKQRSDMEKVLADP